MLNDRIQQVTYICSGFAPVGRHPALFRGAKYSGKVKLVLIGTEVVHQFKDRFVGKFRVAVGLVDLINDHDRFKVQFIAFSSTNRVCGMGPSKASTRRSTPSAMLRTRSTSPPKSE